jgi:hypothetical protein
MLGSFDGRDVVGREKRILRVPVRQGTGLGSPARGTAGTGLAACCGGAGHAVLEELLIFAPPVLPEQRFTCLLPRATARHDPVLSVGCGRGKHAILAAISAAHACKSYLNQIAKAVNFGADPPVRRLTLRVPRSWVSPSMAGRSPAQQASCSQQEELDDRQFTDPPAVADYLPPFITPRIPPP